MLAAITAKVLPVAAAACTEAGESECLHMSVMRCGEKFAVVLPRFVGSENPLLKIFGIEIVDYATVRPSSHLCRPSAPLNKSSSLTWVLANGGVLPNDPNDSV